MEICLQTFLLLRQLNACIHLVSYAPNHCVQFCEECVEHEGVAESVAESEQCGEHEGVAESEQCGEHEGVAES